MGLLSSEYVTGAQRLRNLKSSSGSRVRKRATKSSPRPCAVHGDLVLKMDLTIPAHVECISPLVETVLFVVRKTGIGASKKLEIETALREALANAIKHGCCGDPSKYVQCSVAFETAGSVFLIVSDPGAGFDPEALPDPTGSDHLFDDHGRGIFLINRLMDEVQFKRNGAEIHMRKY